MICCFAGTVPRHEASSRTRLSGEGRDMETLAPSDEVRRPQSSMAARNRAWRRSGQGNRFAQVQLFSDSPGPPPEPQIDLSELKRALPAGRNFH